MTLLEAVENFIRKCRPELTDAAEVRRLALEFWNASPTGELDHVYAALDELLPAYYVGGDVTLPETGALGERREYDVEPTVTFKDGEQVLFSTKAACRVSFSRTEKGWVLTATRPLRPRPKASP